MVRPAPQQNHCRSLFQHKRDSLKYNVRQFRKDAGLIGDC
jgi:hypothetical protein